MSPSHLSRFHLLLLTAFGLGRLRPAPGTWGSLPPVLIVLALQLLLQDRVHFQSLVWIVNGSLVLLVLIASWACLQFGSRGEAHFGRKDASPIVADEVAGQSLALLFLPWRDAAASDHWMWNGAIAGGAFIAFRLMDIIKLPPARSLQRLHGGAGVLIDDLVAGVHALILVQIAARLLLPLVM